MLAKTDWTTMVLSDRYDAMNLYHITEKKNHKSIEENGLLAKWYDELISDGSGGFDGGYGVFVISDLRWIHNVASSLMMKPGKEYDIWEIANIDNYSLERDMVAEYYAVDSWIIESDVIAINLLYYGSFKYDPNQCVMMIDGEYVLQSEFMKTVDSKL